MHTTFRTSLVVAVLLLPFAATRAQQPPPATCPPVAAPVCALAKNGMKQSYWNECQAVRDGAQVLRTGECPQPRSPG